VWAISYQQTGQWLQRAIAAAGGVARAADIGKQEISSGLLVQ